MFLPSWKFLSLWMKTDTYNYTPVSSKNTHMCIHKHTHTHTEYTQYTLKRNMVKYITYMNVSRTDVIDELK